MTAKTFTFKYDPDSSIENMFNEFKQAAEGKLVSVKPDEISSSHIEALLDITILTKIDRFIIHFNIIYILAHYHK